MQELIIHSAHESASLELGRRIGETLEPGDVLALWGELGAGKTLLTRGIARGLSIPPEIPITSPTFTFINEYEGRLHLYHLDLYRLTDLDELETLPWREALFGTGVAVIEWPERLGEWLPEERFDIRISITGEESRTITLKALGERKKLQHPIFRSLLQDVQNSLPKVTVSSGLSISAGNSLNGKGR